MSECSSQFSFPPLTSFCGEKESFLLKFQPKFVGINYINFDVVCRILLIIFLCNVFSLDLVVKFIMFLIRIIENIFLEGHTRDVFKT